MILYLAGLKGVDPSLKEAAAIDGASERQTSSGSCSRRCARSTSSSWSSPSSRRCERSTSSTSSTAARTAWNCCSALVIQNLIGEGQVIGVGSALAVDPAGGLAGPDRDLPEPHVRQGGSVMSRTDWPTLPAGHGPGPAARQPARLHEHGGPGGRATGRTSFLTVMSVIWLIPLLWTLYTSLRPKAATEQVRLLERRRAVQPPQLQRRRGPRAASPTAFKNSAIITIPAVLLTLAARLDGGLRGLAVHLEVQHHAADPVHRGQHAAAAGARRAAVRDVQAHLAAASRSATPATC